MIDFLVKIIAKKNGYDKKQDTVCRFVLFVGIRSFHNDIFIVIYQVSMTIQNTLQKNFKKIKENLLPIFTPDLSCSKPPIPHPEPRIPHPASRISKSASAHLSIINPVRFSILKLFKNRFRNFITVNRKTDGIRNKAFSVCFSEDFK